MRLEKIKELLDAEVLTCDDRLNMEVSYVFGSDLMSDVLSMVMGDIVLLTGITNIQVVRTADMMDIRCIVFVRGKKPDLNVINLAREKGICLMSTRLIMFNSCGILYSCGLKGAEILNGGVC